MKRTFLTTSFFLCCTLCLTAFVAFEGEHEINPGRTEFSNKNAAVYGTFNIFQSPQPAINTKFGPSGQVCAGVNIHFVTGHEKDLDMIAAAGFKYIRMDFVWQTIELTKGTYDWVAYEELTANLRERGLSAIYILDYSNPLYEETIDSIDPITGKERKGLASPQHAESVAAFARWSAAAAEHFKANDIIWEIWNEPNISFWKPVPDVTQYITLAMATAGAIKNVVPDATIIGPATSEVPLPFLETFLASGVLDYLDAVSVHPYRNYAKSPETAGDDYRKLRELIDRYAPAGKKNMPIISSEWGYSTSSKGVSLEKQAEFSVRMQLSNLLYDIPISIWYDWKNDGDDPAEHEQNFGTVAYDLEPKLAYTGLQTLNRQLEGYTFSQRIDLESDNDYVMVFRNGKGNYKISAWTMNSPHAVKLDNHIPGVARTTATDGYGNLLKLKIEQGTLVLYLDVLPQYINLPQGIRLK